MVLLSRLGFRRGVVDLGDRSFASEAAALSRSRSASQREARLCGTEPVARKRLNMRATLNRFESPRAGKVLALAAMILFTQSVADSAAAPDERTRLDCGVNALFMLFHLQGHKVTLDRLEAALPAQRHPDGYSLAELKAAAAVLGMNLEGIQLDKGDKPPGYPAIAFVRDARGGHFAIIRPVGNTGSMIQVIDPPSAPWIADYKDIVSEKVWTGRVLVPQDAWIVRNWISGLAVVAGFALLALAVRRTRASQLAKGKDEHWRQVNQ